MKHEIGLLLTELNALNAYFTAPDGDGEYALTVEDWAKLDRPVRIRLTVEKM